MNSKRPWIVAGTAALAIAGLGGGIAVAATDGVTADLPGQVELTGTEADSAGSPAASANSPAASANSPAASANSPAASANSPAASANSPARAVQDDDDGGDDDGGGSDDSPDAPAAPQPAPVDGHVPVTG